MIGFYGSISAKKPGRRRDVNYMVDISMIRRSVCVWVKIFTRKIYFHVKIRGTKVCFDWGCVAEPSDHYVLTSV